MFVDRITGWFSPATPPTPPTASGACPYDPADPKKNPLNPQGLKPCCACPETKKARDACFLKHDSSESEDKCRELVRSHLMCMRGLGFKV